MKRQSIILVLFITLATQAAAFLDTSDRRRQVAQPAQPTLPSNYWWPYPALTWSSATATATVPATTTMPPTIMVASVSSTTVSLDSTSTSTSDVSSSSSSTSDILTTSIYPQQTNPTSHSHVSRLSTPIIASIAGGIVGICVLILLLCRCCTRRRREHTTRRTSRRRRDRGDVEKGWRRVSIDNQQQQQQSWWNTLFSTRGEKVEEVIPGPRYVGVDDEAERSLISGRDEVRAAAGQQQDELLLPRRTIRRPNPLLLSQPLMSSQSISALAEDEVDDDDNYAIPWESLRHKSIKRAILAKVDEERKWTDSIRGERAANANAAKVGRRQTHVRCDSDFWVDGGGFRIVTESPPQIPTPQSKTWTSLASSFPFLSSEEVPEDRYTPVPARMRSNSRRGSVTSPRRVVERSLLRSPPTVMSPEMESALCFSPVLSTFDRSENAGSDDAHHRFWDPNFGAGQERMQGQRSGDTSAPGTAFTKTYRLRTDRALKRVEAIVESGWTERGVATRISSGV